VFFGLEMQQTQQIAIASQVTARNQNQLTLGAHPDNSE